MTHGAVLQTRLRCLINVVGLLCSFVVNASTPVSGAIAQDSEWTLAGSPYVLSGQVTVTNGAQLLIDAGVVVQMNPGAGLEVVAGSLSAQGTSSSPIKLTSINEVSGSPTAPARGDWGTLSFDSGTVSASTTLTHVDVRYGHGIVMQASSPTLHHIAIDHHIGPAIAIDLQSSPAGDYLSASDNDINGIVVPTGEIGADVSWLLTGIPYVVQQGSIAVGKRSFSLSPSRLTIAQGTTATFEVDIPEPAPTGGLNVALACSNTSVATVPSSVVVAAGAQTSNVSVNGVALGSTTITANQAGYGATTATVDVITPASITLLPASTSLAFGDSLTMTATLSNIAPSSGVVVALTSSDSGIASVPTQVAIPPGQTSAPFPALGLGVGSVNIGAAAAGYANGTASVTVHSVSLRLPSSIIVPPSGNVDVTLILSDPAPAGGVTVSLITGNAAIATAPASILVPANAQNVTFTLAGVAAGTATLGASAPGYTSATAPVTVTAISILFNPGSSVFNIPQGSSQSLQLQLSKPAPAGGVAVMLSTDNTTLASVWPTVITVPQGQATATQSVTVTGTSFLGNASTYLRARSPGLTETATLIRVEGPAGISFHDYFSGGTNIFVGKGLTCCYSLEIDLVTTDGYSYSTPAPITVALTSSDPGKVNVPTTLTIPAGANYVHLNVSGVDFTLPDAPVTITATAQGFPLLSNPLSVNVVAPQLLFSDLAGYRGVLGARDNFKVQWLVPGGPTSQTVTTAQSLTLSIAADNPAGLIAGFHDAASGGNSTTQVGVPAGQELSASVYVDSPTTAGTYQVQAALPGVGAWTSATQTVSATSLQFLNLIGPNASAASWDVGLGLVTSQLAIGLVGNNGQRLSDQPSFTVNLTSSDPTAVTVPATAIVGQGTYAIVPLSGLALTTSPVTITASAAGYPTLQLPVNVVSPSLNFNFLDGYRALSSSRDIFSIGWSVLGSGSQNAIASQTFNLSIANANPLGIVAGFHTSSAGGSVTSQLTIPAGSNSSSTSIYIDQPTASGTYQVQAALTGVGTWSSNVQSVGVYPLTLAPASGASVSPLSVGRGLANLAKVSTIFTPTAPITVNLSSSDPSTVVVPSTVTIPASCCGSVQFPVSGLAITSSPVTITASAPGAAMVQALQVNVSAQDLQFGYLTGSRRMGEGPAVFVIGWPGNQTAIAAQTFDLSVAQANPGGIVAGFQDGIGQPITQLTIDAGHGVSGAAYVSSPVTAGTYAVQADLQGGDSWTSATQAVSTSLAISTTSLKNSEVVGLGLQSNDPNLYVSFNPGLNTDAVVHLACVDSTVCSVTPTVLTLAPRDGGRFKINALGLGSTQVIASADGYPSPPGLNVSVVSPAVQIYGLPSIVPSGQTAGFSVFFSVPGGYGLQPPINDIPITLTSSNPAVATVPAMVTISAGQSISGSLQLNGVSPGTTTLTASGANLTPTTTQPITVQ